MKEESCTSLFSFKFYIKLRILPPVVALSLIYLSFFYLAYYLKHYLTFFSISCVFVLVNILVFPIKIIKNSFYLITAGTTG